MTIRHRVLAGADEVRARVAAVAAELSAAHPSGCTLVGVLTGSVVFTADLARAMAVPVRVDFVGVSSYRPDAGRVRLVKDLDLDVSGESVVIVHDVVHTGLTTAFLVGEMQRRGASTVDVCALVDRVGRRVVPVPVRAAGFVVHDDYVVGMGLDHRGRYRNLASLVLVDEVEIDADAGAFSGDVYLHAEVR